MKASEILAATRATEIAGVETGELEVDLRLVREAHEKATGEMSGNEYRNRQRGQAVRVRVYAGGDAEALSGEVLVARPDDITHAEPLKGFNGESLVKIEFRKTVSDNTLIIMWLPADQEFKSLKVVLP